MEQQCQEMGQIPLKSDLWQTLPDVLIDKIIDKVLVDLPFSRIFSFCYECERWKDILLSTHYILYFHADTCIVFNPRTDLWESISLQFCEAEGQRLQDMQLVSCGGGLLFLSSDVNDEFLVCNPLTRCYKRLRGPAGRLFCDAECGRRVVADTKWGVVLRQVCPPPPVSIYYCLLVQVAVYSDTGYFHVLALKFYKKSDGDMFLTDSRTETGCRSWVTIDDVPDDFYFLVEPTVVSKGSVILGFASCPGGFKVLTYNVELKSCGWISNIRTLRCTPNSTPSTRKILAATLSGDCELEFFEVRDTGSTLELAKSPFPPSTKGRCKISFATVQQNFTPSSLTAETESSEIFNIAHLGHGDIAHDVSILQLLPSGQVEVSVWTHSPADNSDHISNWKEWRPSGQEPGQLPSARHFHIFQPSFLSPERNTQCDFSRMKP